MNYPSGLYYHCIYLIAVMGLFLTVAHVDLINLFKINEH